MTDVALFSTQVADCLPVTRVATCYLEHPRLGILDLTAPGYAVTDLSIGHPAERPIERDRALNDGRIDETTFLGGRAVTLSVMFDTRVLPWTTLRDALKAYMSPRLRPLLVWSYFGAPDDLRALELRGVDAPEALSGSRFPVYVTSWKSPWSYMRSPEASVEVVRPSQIDEEGRAYNLVPDRSYPAQLPAGSFYAINAGNSPSDWTAVIAVGGTGTVDNPSFSVNGVDMTFDQNGGLSMPAGATLVIDTAARTMLLNNDPTTPRFDRVNFLDWNWEDLQIQPGTNIVSFQHSGTSTEAAATVSWYPSWL